MDLPSDQTHKANPGALTLPDTITELDLFAPMPDPEELLREPEERAPGQDPTLLDYGMSQIIDSQTPTRTQQRRTLALDNDDMGLDLGLDDDGVRGTPDSDGPSIEMGRRAPTLPRDEPTLLDNDDLGLDFGMDNDTTLRQTTEQPDDFQMGGMDEEIEKANAAALERAKAAGEQRQRESASPLSEIRDSMERDLERTFQLDQAMNEEEDETMAQAQQRAKRRKLVRIDHHTEFSSSELKKLQEDRSAITKAPTYLPRDPLLLSLMEMQRNGTFVSNLMGDGRMQGWAPELRGILSLEVVRSAGDKKRKRDSGIADVDSGSNKSATPQLEIPGEDDFGVQAGAGNDFDATANDDAPLNLDEEFPEDEAYDAGVNFDITEAPLLHPSQSGPVAIGTKKMVHMLREHFAPEHPTDSNEPPTPSKRVKSSALFTDLCPEKQTTKQDATKMFFELLVLGTKDAIKVEQESKGLGMPIRVRGKRGLWGDWAEMQSGGEIATQDAAVRAEELAEEVAADA